MKNILVFGAGPEERAWVDWLNAQAGPAPIHSTDLDEAMAIPNLDAAIIGGPIETRGEALRRAAAEGLAIVCLHPPGPNADAYYQVSMSQRETGAVIVPDLPLRLHPGIAGLRETMTGGEPGDFRSPRLVAPAAAGEDLARVAFARAVDVARALLGEIEAVTASGDPPGAAPEFELIVQLRSADGRRAEVRVSTDPAETARVTLAGSRGPLIIDTFDDWDPRAAILGALQAARDAVRHRRPLPSPSLLDGARTMELAEAVVESLRRGRTIDARHERIDERTNFRAVMTSVGCLVLCGVPAVFAAALAGRALGFDWAVGLVYLVPPALIAFAALQLLQLGIGREPSDSTPSREKIQN